jgi:hypothetical protein
VVFGGRRKSLEDRAMMAVARYLIGIFAARASTICRYEPLPFARIASFSIVVLSCLSLDLHQVNAANEETNGRLLLEVKLDIGSTDPYDRSGTVFEVSGASGPVAGFGFPEIFNTYRHSNDSILHGFVRDGNKAFELREIGKAKDWLTSYFLAAPTRLVSANPSQGWALSGLTGQGWRSIEPKTFADIQLDAFGIDPTELKEDCGYVMGLRLSLGFFGNCLVGQGRYFSLRGLAKEFGSADARMRPVFAGAGHAVLIREEADGRRAGFAICALLQGPKLEGCSYRKYRLTNEFPYAIGVIGPDIVVTLNTGAIIRYSPATKEFTERESDGFSLQLYSFARYGKKSLWGQYPDGMIGELSGTEFQADAVQLPIDDYRMTAEPELQSLGIYKGTLFAGVWPFGQVFAKSGEGETWRLVDRLFPGPPIGADTGEPFSKQTQGNYFGQRITDMIAFGDSLYIATGSKTGVLPSIPEGRDGAAVRAIAPEYGKVWRLHSTGALSAPLVELAQGKKMALTLRLFEKRIEIHGEKLLADAEVSGAIECIDKVTTGSGTFGDLRGVTAKASVTYNALGCSGSSAPD